MTPSHLRPILVCSLLGLALTCAVAAAQPLEFVNHEERKQFKIRMTFTDASGAAHEWVSIEGIGKRLGRIRVAPNFESQRNVHAKVEIVGAPGIQWELFIRENTWDPQASRGWLKRQEDAVAGEYAFHLCSNPTRDQGYFYYFRFRRGGAVVGMTLVYFEAGKATPVKARATSGKLEVEILGERPLSFAWNFAEQHALSVRVRLWAPAGGRFRDGDRVRMRLGLSGPLRTAFRPRGTTALELQTMRGELQAAVGSTTEIDLRQLFRGTIRAGQLPVRLHPPALADLMLSTYGPTSPGSKNRLGNLRGVLEATAYEEIPGKGRVDLGSGSAEVRMTHLAEVIGFRLPEASTQAVSAGVKLVRAASGELIASTNNAKLRRWASKHGRPGRNWVPKDPPIPLMGHDMIALGRYDGVCVRHLLDEYRAVWWVRGNPDALGPTDYGRAFVAGGAGASSGEKARAEAPFVLGTGLCGVLQLAVAPKAFTSDVRGFAVGVVVSYIAGKVADRVVPPEAIWVRGQNPHSLFAIDVLEGEVRLYVITGGAEFSDDRGNRAMVVAGQVLVINGGFEVESFGRNDVPPHIQELVTQIEGRPTADVLGQGPGVDIEAGPAYAEALTGSGGGGGDTADAADGGSADLVGEAALDAAMRAGQFEAAYQRLVDEEGSEFGFTAMALSADGSQIFFAGIRPDRYSVVGRIATTGGPVDWFDLPDMDGRTINGIACAADGSSAFLVAHAPGRTARLYRAAGGRAQQVLDAHDPDEHLTSMNGLQCSADGSRAFFLDAAAYSGDVYASGSTSSSLRKLIEDTEVVHSDASGGKGYRINHFAVDGAGQTIAFVLEGWFDRANIHVRHSQPEVFVWRGGAPRQLTSDAEPTLKDRLSMSADGSRIVYVTGSSYVALPSSGGLPVEIASTGANHAGQALTANGAWMFYGDTESRSGRFQRTDSRRGLDAFPPWNVGGITLAATRNASISADGRTVAFLFTYRSWPFRTALYAGRVGADAGRVPAAAVDRVTFTPPAMPDDPRAPVLLELHVAAAVSRVSLGPLLAGRLEGRPTELPVRLHGAPVDGGQPPDAVAGDGTYSLHLTTGDHPDRLPITKLRVSTLTEGGAVRLLDVSLPSGN